MSTSQAAARVTPVHGKLLSINEVAAAIESGKVLWLAGDENQLKQLPKGRWIGGSIPYFMAQNGGQTTRDMIYVSEMTHDIATKLSVKFYDVGSIYKVAKEAPEHGFTILLIPALTDMHLSYAQHAPSYEEMFIKPIAGWITGIHLDDLGTIKPSVFNGVTGESSTDKGLAMHITLKPNKIANISIVNTFAQGDGDTIEFPETGFSVSTCTVNGMERNFTEYVTEKKLDTRLPLVANYSGTMINVSFQKVDEEAKTVSFYAPVFNGVKYKQAAAIPDFVSAFQAAIPKLDHDVTFSCNCVLNYVHSGLEGKRTANMTGPMTFGEIAYQLLNQTLVYMTVEDTH
jgi:hypothetical protein